MNRLNKLEVFYHERLVGTIALYQNRLAAFEYDSNWLANGFSISPFPLPLEKKVFIPKIDPFEGLLETSHRIPNLDYDILMQLTLQLTKSMEECENCIDLCALMCMRITGMTIRRILLICMMKMNVAGNCHRRMTSPTVIQSVESMLPR